jgi:hypothetical protein
MRIAFSAALRVSAVAAVLAFAAPAAADQASPKHPLAQEHPIVVDGTAITPPMPWSVPGVTEPVQSVRDRMVTDKVVTLKLRPGRYMFMTTIFSFEFMVDLDGKLDYVKTLDQCVGGRGTTTLLVKCRKTQAIGP